MDLADFYEELALLVRSNLPLPEGLRQLAASLPSSLFRQALEDLGGRTARGERFSTALPRHPQWFQPFHTRLIAAGEQSGLLSEALMAVARFTRMSNYMAGRLKDVVAYPLFTGHLALLVMLGVFLYLLPSINDLLRDLLSTGGTLPPITRGLLAAARFLKPYTVEILSLYGGLLLFSLWCFTPFESARRTLLWISGRLPGSSRLVESLDASRLCWIWSLFLAQRLPMPEALQAAGQFMQSPSLAGALERIAADIRSGRMLAESLAAEPAVDPLLALTLRHAPEADLPAELMHLAELYGQRVESAVRSALSTWTVLATVCMALLVAAVILTIFQPLIGIIRSLAAY